VGDTLTTFADSTDPTGLAFAPDGSLYMAEWTKNRVRRRAPDGTITLVTGTGVAGFSGDGGPAELAQVNRPNDVAVGPDGAVYIAEDNGHRVRRISPDGIITTYAGTGVSGTPTSGARATATPIGNPRAVAVGQDGTVYVGTTNRVVRIGTDGVLTLFAGTTTGTTPATQTALSNVNQLVATRDNGLIVATFVTIYRVSLDGAIETVAGRHRTRCITLTQAVHCEPFVDGNLAGQTFLEGVTGAAVAPDGSLLFAESNFNSGKYFIRRVRPAMPGLTFGSMLIAADDGSEVYQFDAAGRHLFTRNANTGDTLYAFGHDSAGRLVTVRDAHANVTTIERSPTTGVATTIVAPFGQRTTLETDGAGYLNRVLDPAGNAVRLFSRSNGLLDSMVTPRGQAYRFAYDGVGRLISDHDPAGGSQTLTRTKSDTGYTVAVTTEMGRTTQYKVDRLPGGDERRETVAPNGLGMVTTRRWNGETVRVAPDGTIITTTETADPRYGIQAPYIGRVAVRLPSGDSSVVSASRSVSLANANDPLSLRGASETVTINGQNFLTRDTLLAGTVRTTTTTPEGRQTFFRTDSVGRVQMARTGGLDSVLYRYDGRGRLDRVQSGGQAWTVSRDTRSRPVALTDPLGRSDSLFYDDADRVTRRVLPGGREVLFAYDSSGNLTAVTPPTRTAHGFGYTPIDLTTTYVPPNVGLTTPATVYAYNADRQLTRITRPDSVAVQFEYDTPGRLSAVTFDRGQLVYSYGPSTGKLNSITAPGNNTLTYTYDGALAKAMTWAGMVQGAVQVGYNKEFRVDTISVNGANGVAFGYDRDGLLTTAGALGIKRHAQHGRLERDSLSTVKSAYSYSSRGSLAGYAATYGASTLLQTAYVRDSLDRITQLTETMGVDAVVIGFTYDSAGRLQEVKRDGAVTAAYEYDQNGNRLNLTTSSGSVTGVYDAQDRVNSYGGTSYTYGSNGELRTKTNGANATSYTYDAIGNLTGVALPNGTNITYVIDGQNRRVGKKVNDVLVLGFLYQGQLSPVAELDGSQQVVSRFVYGTRATVPDYMIKGDSTYRLIADHLGSIRLVVNTADGMVAQRIDYDEFGRITQNTAPGFQPFGFAGGLVDDQTGLVRFGVRDYDPETGRWTAKDALRFAGGDPNLYLYVGNDPVNSTDPTGTFSPTIATGLLAGAFAGIEAWRGGGDKMTIARAAAFGFFIGLIPGYGFGGVSNPILQRLLTGGSGGFVGNLLGQIPGFTTCPAQFDFRRALLSAGSAAAGNLFGLMLPFGTGETLPGALLAPIIAGLTDMYTQPPTMPSLVPTSAGPPIPR
jgi:RHS repeat-associated protein